MAKWLFSGSILVNAALFSLLVLVTTGPLFSSGEQWEGLALLWAFSLPLMAFFALALSRGYSSYLAAVGTAARLWRYFLYVVVAALAAPGVTVLIMWALTKVPGAP